MARAAADSGQGDPFAVNEEAALAELELAWSYGGYHAFSAGDGHWCAVSSAGEVLTGVTPDELDRAIRGALGRLAVTGQARPLRVVNGAEDSVARRQRFEQVHPEAVILPPSAGRWRVVVPPGLIPGDGTRTTLGAWDLGALMDQLDAIYGADGGTALP